MLMPTYKSYLDFLLLSYVNFQYKFSLPFVCGTEDFLNITLLTSMLRSCGGFFTDRTQLKNELYACVFQEYITAILKKRYCLEFFLERNRGKAGKILSPSEQIFKFIMDAYISNYDQVKDLIFIPITINYDRVFEVETFPFELLGEKKFEPSLMRTLAVAKNIGTSYGRVHINYCTPISAKQYMAEHFGNKQEEIMNEQPMSPAKMKCISALSYEIVHIFTENLIVMPT